MMSKRTGWNGSVKILTSSKRLGLEVAQLEGLVQRRNEAERQFHSGCHWQSVLPDDQGVDEAARQLASDIPANLSSQATE
jgi:hypothetical protein